MKRKKSILLLLCLSLLTLGQAQVSKTVNSTAGNLSGSFSPAEKKALTNLKVTGTLNKSDFFYMRDSLSVIQILDLSEARIISPLDTIPDQAFKNKKTLQKISFPTNLVRIGSTAFYSCSGLLSVEVPATVTSIGASAFSFCGLKSVILPPTKISYYGWAFNNCDSLLTATTPYTNDGGDIFMGSRNLRTIIVPEGVTTIQDGAFYQLTSMTKIILPSTLTSIGTQAFYNCTSLDSITIPEGVTSIGDGAFWECNKMKSLRLPKSLISIKSTGFAHCRSLTSVEIPVNATSVESAAFRGCTGLITVITSSANGNYGGNIFEYCTNIKNIIIPEGTTAIKNYAFSTNFGSVTSIKIPASVKSIGERAFYACSGIESISIPDSVSTIGAYAFSGCSGLKSVIIPNAVNNLGIYSFQNCSNLSELTLSTALSSINEGVFSGCAKLASVSFPGSLVSLGKSAFSGCTALVLNTLPSTINSIGESCFSACIGLKSIVIPSSVSVINNSVFSGCTGLTSVQFPNSLSSIGYQAFSGCNALTSITIPAYTTINYNAFQNCKGLITATTPYAYNSGNVFEGCLNLKTIVIPSGMSSIKDYAFQNCNTLDSIQIPNSVYTIGNNAFFGCSNLKKLSLPKYLNTIKDNAFANCSSLNSISLPATLSVIPNNCFSRCIGLSSITIPVSISTISSYAFDGCTGLNSIFIENSFPVDLTKYTSVFNSVNKTTCILNVPYGTKARYLAANQWSDFTNIVEKSTGIFISSNKVELSSNPGSSISIDVKANVAWTASSNQSWLTVTPESGTGDNTLTFTSDNTQITTIRNAKITLSAPGFVSQTVEVTQKLAPKTVSISAGGLSAALTADELNSLSTLIVTGTMDARDFKVMRDSMPQLTDLDLSGVSITAYTGVNGTYTNSMTYSANIFPIYAFQNSNTGKGKTSLKNIKLPTTITSIGSNAFGGCSGLTTFSIPSSVVSIGSNAFYNCTGLSSITIPTLVSTIGSYAFYNCTGLTSIIVNSSYPIDLTIPTYVFYNINKTTCSLYVPYGSKTLYSATTQWKDFAKIVENATGFILSTNKLKIPYNAGSSINIDIKSNVAWTVSSDQPWLTVNTGSGSGNSTLALTAETNTTSTARKVIITISAPDCISQTVEVTQSIAPKTIDITAGGLYTALTTDELSSLSSLTLTGTLDARDFKTLRDKMPMLTDIDFTGTSILAYTGTEGTYPSLGSIIYPANTIPQNAFYGKTILKSAVIPSTVTAIGNYAFQNCTGLNSFSIPSTINSLGSNAFYGCSGLTSIYSNSSYPIDLSNSYSVFYNVNRTTCTLYVPYKAKALYAAVNQWNAFTNMVENSQGFMVGSNKIKIAYAKGSTGSIDISANVSWTATSDQSWVTVSPATGSGDGKLTFIVDQNDSTSRRYANIILSSAGYGSQIITVTQTGFPKTINITAGGLFKSLTSTELSSTANLIITGTMDARDFKTMRDNMPELAYLDLSGATISAYTGAEGTWMYSSAYYANAIPTNAFYNSTNSVAKTSLISIKLPSNIISIDYSAFKGCTGLISFTIPSSVSSISYYAFQGCSNLTSIYVNSTSPIDLTNSNMVFDAVNKTNCTIYVPYATKELYVVANQWKDFTNIIEDTTGFLVESNNVKLRSSEGSSAQVHVKSNIEWTVSSDQSWLKVQPASGIGNDSIIVTAEINSKAIIRNATITVSAPGEKSQTINVIQTGTTKIINNTAGGLKSTLISEEIKNVSELTINGTIDASDFYFMRDSLPLLTFLDIRHAKIVAYLGNSYTGYAANVVPLNAFYNPSTSKGKASLVSISLPLTATGIFDGAFQSCTGLIDINIPSSIKTIGKSSFSTCTSLKEVVLPDSVSALGEASFANCTKFKTFTIPPLVTSIGVNAFINCTGLTTINAQPDVPVDVSANWGVFYNVDKINCILNVPYGKRALYLAANQWKDFSNIIEISNGVLLSKNNLKVPNKAVGTIVIRVISNGAWTVSCDKTWLTVSPQDATGTDSITINIEDNPDIFIRSSIITVSTVGAPSKKIIVTQAAKTKVLTVNAGGLYSALTYEERSKVSDIKIKGTIDARDFRIMRDSMPLLSILDMGEVNIAKYIGNQGPANDVNKTYNINYPANTIPDQAFYKFYYEVLKNNLTSVILPQSIISIGLKAFSECSGLDSISIPNSVSSINGMAFQGCTGLKSINFGNSLNFIDYNAFSFCTALTKVIFPNSLKTIGIRAFEYCSNLNDITFPNSLTSILSEAFQNCTSLKKLVLPNSLTSLGQYNFRYCRSLEEVTFGNSLTTIGAWAFEECNMLNNITIPNSVTIIDDQAFSGCNNLRNIKLSSSLIKLGYGAFQYCQALTSFSIPASVVTIEARVFDHSGIKTIYSYPVSPVVTIPYNEMFQEFDKSNCVLYVPIGSKSAYQNAYEWKDFKSIIEMPTDVPALNSDKINIYLDPVSESFTIQGIEGTCNISVYNLDGKAMLCKQVQPNENISISNFPRGLYVVRINSKKETIDLKVLKK